MNHEDYCSYELSKKLKERGFDWECNYFYNELIDGSETKVERAYIYANWNDSRSITKPFSVPTLSQAQKWLREEKGIAINVIAHDGGFYQWEEVYLPNAPEYDGYIKHDIAQYPTYEQALSAGITKVLELI